MDFWNRLLGTTIPEKKPAKPANDPQARLARFKRVYTQVVELCNRPRNLNAEQTLLDDLHTYLDRLTILLRDETRAPVPHVCFQYSAGSHIYAAIARAAIVSQYEPVIRSSIAVFAALVDSEEEDFLAKEMFAKSLMRLVRKVIESGEVLVNTETETAILELLFTIAAKIRLQPEILPVWFHSTAKPELEDVFIKEKKSFVGITQKDDFPLCYLLIDRVHHEGRIGDFARTGLLYVFEATGRSADLEEWVISSDLPTLMASGLGALYSQLSRELSILHADADLPAVLAMSDYSTTHPRATATSAFSARHQTHMTTFLSYLAFWQDVLDHCRSADVKQTLLDHYQILFLQQLLYPSLLQSSDTDAGSSVAVLTYMTAILEALEYPDLIDMMLRYLLALPDHDRKLALDSRTVVDEDAPPRSPTAVKRRQSLILLNAPQNPDDAVEPSLFSLVDLIINNVGSQNSQAVFAALRLSSTLLMKQKNFAFGALLKLQEASAKGPQRSLGALEAEISSYYDLVAALHQQYSLDTAYTYQCEDMRHAIEAQTELLPSTDTRQNRTGTSLRYMLLDNDPLLRMARSTLRTFWTNSIDVNLALTQTIMSIAQCVEIRTDGWLCMSTASGNGTDDAFGPRKAWQSYLDAEETSAWAAVSHALDQPVFNAEHAPLLYGELAALITELDNVRERIPTLDSLIASRKIMLQAGSSDATMLGQQFPLMGDRTEAQAASNAHNSSRGHSRSSSTSAAPRGRKSESVASSTTSPHLKPAAGNAAESRTASRGASVATGLRSSLPPAAGSLFQPPPPESPSTTDILMQVITFPAHGTDRSNKSGNMIAEEDNEDKTQSSPETRSSSLNHVLTNVVILQEFVLEIVAVLQIRAAVLGDKEVRTV